MRSRLAQAAGPGCGGVHTWALGLCVGVHVSRQGGGSAGALTPGSGVWSACLVCPGWRARLRGCAHLGPWAQRRCTAYPGRVAGLPGRSPLALGFECVYPGWRARLRGCAHLGPWAQRRCTAYPCKWRVCRGAHTWLWGLERVLGVPRLAGQAAGICTPEPLGLGLWVFAGCRARLRGCALLGPWLRAGACISREGGGSAGALTPGSGVWGACLVCPGWHARLRGCAHLGPRAQRVCEAYQGRAAGLRRRSHLLLGPSACSVYPGWWARLRGCAHLGLSVWRRCRADPYRVAGLQGRSHLSMGDGVRSRLAQAAGPGCGGVHTWALRPWAPGQPFGVLRQAGQAAGMCTPGPLCSA